MGLSYGVAIITSSDVGSITHESSLTNLDDTPSSAILSNSMSEATNELIRRARGRGIDPSQIDSDTITELKAAAAYYACYLVFSAQNQADEENVRKAASYKARFEEQMSIVVIRTTVSANQINNPRGIPVVGNVNSTWLIGGRDTTTPNGFPDETWITKTQSLPKENLAS